MAPLHAALPPPSAAAHHHAAAPPVFLARSPYHPRRAASCSLATAASSSRKAFLSCPPDHWIAAAPPRAIPSSSSSPALIASVQDLNDFIYSGPLVDRIGYTDEKIAESIDRWLLAGARLARLFRLNELQLSEAEKARIYHFYIPVFLWCEDQVMEHRAKYNDGDDIPPLVIGVSAPQGSGKTTLVFALDYLFRVAGRNSVTLSIDDFYLTAKEQNELRDRNSGNALLELRGNAGSHDLQFSVETLESLIKLTKEGMKMKVPRYDKSAFGGRGDRADPSVWPEVEGPLEVVLFEGWMLGFKPLPNEDVKKVDPQLEVVNKNLEAYYGAWDRFIQSWIVIKIREPSCVYQWRLQAEVAMRADGKPGMSDEEVMDFVSRYLPAYQAYLPTLYKEGPNGSNPDNLLVIDIDENRNPICGGSWDIDLVMVVKRRGGKEWDKDMPHSDWINTVQSEPDVISMSFLPITSLLNGVPGCGFLNHAINLYLRYKPPIEELHQFLEFQLPRQWAPVYSDHPLGPQRRKQSSASLPLSFMGPRLYVCTNMVDVGERPVTGIRLYLEGKKSNMLAIHLQHLCSLPQILQLQDDPYNHRTPEPYDHKYLEPFGSWKRFSHVYTAPVESDDDSSIVTGAQVHVSSHGLRKVLFLRLNFSKVSNAALVKNPEWEGSPNLGQKSGLISTLISTHFSTAAQKPAPRPADVNINSAVYPGGPPAPAQAPKLLKYVDTAEMVRGPQDTPGYWVVSGAKLQLERGKISLRVKYSLLTDMVPDDEHPLDE